MTKILVIEDEAPYRENIIDLLEAEEFEAIDAENGLIGVQLAKSEAPDLILCDVMMPHLDGYGVLRALRQDPTTAAIPFIFLTAKADKADFRSGMALGADDYITKPFTRAELLEAIAARLARQRNITQPLAEALQQATERLNHLLHYDSVTNLPNRVLLRDLFNQIISHRQSEEQSQAQSLGDQQAPHSIRPIPIFLLGLDRFNRLNDSLCNQEIDSLIKEFSERITSCLSKQDPVARLNLEQFVIIPANLSERQTIISLAQSLLTSISEPLMVNHEPIVCTSSIGISFYPHDGQELNELLKKAATAMANTQKLGGNYYHFYSRELEVDHSSKLALEASLRRAIEREEFRVYYQPIVDLHAGKILGAEALVRWIHPTRGMISPAEFIPLAEETGLIVPIGEWVLQTACTQAQQWNSSGFSPFRISVNISARQFYQSNLIQRIIQTLETTGLNPAHLELEITESLFVENPETVNNTINELQQLGITVAIDDFGTGYATLNYLRQFPFNTLKVDQCFVRGASTNLHNTAILTAVIQLAHNLNLNVVAEGVETEAERDFLSQQRCNAMQGYLFSRPVPSSELENLLINH